MGGWLGVGAGLAGLAAAVGVWAARWRGRRGGTDGRGGLPTKNLPDELGPDVVPVRGSCSKCCA